MKVYRFEEYSLNNSMVDSFIESLQPIINEASGGVNRYESALNKIVKDLKLNVQLVTTFGAGIGAFYPIVESLMRNMGSVEVTTNTVVLLTITAISIIYLEEEKNKIKDEDSFRKNCKSMLEELKMMGIGNGIVKKLVEGLKSIKNIFSIIGKHIGAVVGGFMDMFAYTAMLIPIMNAINSIVGKYDLNFDTLPQNFLGLGIGIGTIITKHGIAEIIDRIKSRFPNGDRLNKKKILDEIETPIIQKIGDVTFGDSESDQDGDLIKEQ